jgi:hypothetical protein
MQIKVVSKESKYVKSINRSLNLKEKLIEFKATKITILDA